MAPETNSLGIPVYDSLADMGVTPAESLAQIGVNKAARLVQSAQGKAQALSAKSGLRETIQNPFSDILAQPDQLVGPTEARLQQENLSRNSNAIDALQSAAAHLGNKLEYGLGTGIEALGQTQQSDTSALGSHWGKSLGDTLQKAGKTLKDDSQKFDATTDQFYGYDNGGSKMTHDVWTELKHGNIGKALSHVTGEGTLELIAQSVPEMTMYANPAALLALYGSNVAEAKNEAEKLNNGKPISNGRMGAILLGEAVSIAVERWAIGKMVGPEDLVAKGRDLLAAAAGKAAPAIINGAAKYIAGKVGGMTEAAVSEGSEEVIQEGQRILTTQAGQQDMMTQQNLDRLGESGIGGALAGAGMRGGADIYHGTGNVPGAIGDMTNAVKTSVSNAAHPQKDEHALELAGATNELTMDDSARHESAQTYLEMARNSIDSGNLDEANNARREAMKHYLDMDPATKEAVQLKKDILDTTAQLTKAPDLTEIKSVVSRYKADEIPQEETLGSRAKLETAFDLGTRLDASDAELHELATALGITSEKVEDYTKVRTAVDELTKVVEDNRGAKKEQGDPSLFPSDRKSMAEVEYEATIGPRGFLKQYEQMQQAAFMGDTATAESLRASMQNFRSTQEHKVAQLRQAIDTAKQSGAQTKVAYSMDPNAKPFTIHPTEAGMRAAQGVLHAAETTLKSLNTILSVSQKMGTPTRTETRGVPKQFPVAEKKTVSEPTSKKQPTPVKGKEQSKDVYEPEADAVTEYKPEMNETYRPPVRSNEAHAALMNHHKVTTLAKRIGSIIDKIGITPKGQFKDVDKAYLENPGIGSIQNGKVVLSDDVLKAMSLAYINWISQDAERTTTTTVDDMKRMIGKKGKSLSAEETAILEGKGILRKNVIQSLGEAIVGELQIDIDKSESYAVRSNLITGLGHALYAAMRRTGQFTESTISPDDWYTLTGQTSTAPIPMVKFNMEKAANLAAMKDIRAEIKPLLVSEGSAKEPVYGPIEPKARHEFRKRPTAKMSPADNERLRAQEQITHKVKQDVYAAFQKLGDFGKLAAGWVDLDAIKKTTHTNTLKAHQAVNNAIERSLTSLHDHVASAGEGGYHFNYFMSGNGRDMIDSNTFNPQSDKLHRHMDYTGEPVTVDPSKDSRTHELFKVAVLQGMDVGVDKATTAKLKAEWAALLANENALQYAKALVGSKPLSKAQQKNIAEFAAKHGKIHTIDALVALGHYLEGKPFQTTLQLEVDAVTSGWILALLQSPMFAFDKVKDYLAKGGVYIGDMEANYQQRSESKVSPDSYETVRDTILGLMPKYGLSKDVTDLMPIDRNFAKSPFMTHVTYGAGIDGVLTDISETFIQNLYDRMASGKEGYDQGIAAIKELTGETIKPMNPLTYVLPKALKTKISERVRETYGAAVKQALSLNYKQFTDVRNTINKAFQEMFSTYAAKYDEGFKALQAKGKVTKADLDGLERSLAKYIPTIKSPNGTDVQIFKREKIEALDKNDLTVQTKFNSTIAPDIAVNSIKTTAEMKRIAASVAAGGVVPIHFIDGAIIGELLKSFQMTGVYDAAMLNLTDVDSATKMYNEKLIEISKNYNLLKEVVTAAKHFGVSDETLESLESALATATEMRDQIYAQPLNVQHFAMDGIAYKTEDKASGDEIGSTPLVSNPETKPITKSKEYSGIVKQQSDIRNSENSEDVADAKYTTAPKDEWEMARKRDVKEAEENHAIAMAHEDALLQEEADRLFSDVTTRTEDLKEIHSIQTGIVNNPEKVRDLIQSLDKYDNVKVSNEHKTHLDKVIDMFISPVKEFIPEMNVKIAKHVEKTDGQLSITAKDIHVRFGTVDQTTGLQKSIREVLVHELIHAATAFAIRYNRYGAYSAIRRIEKLKDIAKAHLTAEHLIDPNSPYDHAEDLKEAQTVLDYVMNDAGPDEFIAHGLTNENFMRALSQINVYEKHTKGEGIIGTLMSLTKTILDTVFSHIRNETGMKVDKALLKLAIEVAEANNKAIVKTERNIIANLFEIQEGVSEKIASFIDSKLKGIEDSHYKPGKRNLLHNLIKFTLDKEAKDSVLRFLDNQLPMLFDKRGSLQTIWADFRDKDPVSRFFEKLALSSSQIERQKHLVEQTYTRTALAGFKSEPDVYDRSALGNAVVDTDASSIDVSPERLAELMKSNPEIDKEIAKAFKTIDESEGTKSYYGYQLEGLGRYMATHTTHIDEQQLSTHNIIARIGGDEKFKPALDKIAALYAVRFTPEASRLRVANLLESDPDGVINVMELQKNITKTSKEYLFKGEGRFTQQIQGYTRDVTDPDTSVLIEPIFKEDELAREGYKLVKRLQKDPKDTSNITLGLFISDEAVRQPWHRSLIIIADKGSRGSTLMQAHANASGEYGSKRAKADIQSKSADGVKLFEQMRNGTYQVSDESKMIPILRTDGSVQDYRYTMSKADKKKYLSRNDEMQSLLGRTAASVSEKYLSQKLNLDAVDSMIADMKDNFKHGDYIEMKAGSEDPVVQEVWEVLPTYLKNHIKYRLDGGNLWVRKDLFNLFFGFRELSVDKAWGVDKLSNGTRHSLRIGEKIWKEIIAVAKVNIVIRMPAVLLGNIVSNVNLSVMLGVNPYETIKLQLQAIDALKQYKANEKELVAMELQESMGKPIDKVRKKRLKFEMETSSIRDMMDAGLFQAIIEDVPVGEIENPNKVARFFDNLSKDWNPYVRTGLSYAFISRDTPVFKAMMLATQYSDFVARYSVYHVLTQKNIAKGMTEVQAKEKALDTAIDAFINYDLPDSKLIQYANDIGLVMFTKYLQRIQRVIRQGVTKHPLSFTMALLGQEALMDVSDPTDSSVFARGLFSPFDSPINRAADAFTPMGVSAVNKYIL